MSSHAVRADCSVLRASDSGMTAASGEELGSRGDNKTVEMTMRKRRREAGGGRIDA